MAYEATAFTESTDISANNQYNSFCFSNFTYVQNSVTGSRSDAVQLNGFRITFTGAIQDNFQSTSCVWEDLTSIVVRFFGPDLNVLGETRTITITSNIAEIDLSAEAAKFQYISSFEFDFFKKDVTSGTFVTSVEVDPASVVADPFWTDYKNTREVC